MKAGFFATTVLAILLPTVCPALAMTGPPPKWQCTHSEGKVFLSVAMVPDLAAEAAGLAMPDKGATLTGAMTFHLWITLNPDGTERSQSTSLRLDDFRYQRKGQTMPDAKLSLRLVDGDKDVSNDEKAFLDVANMTSLVRVTPNDKIRQRLAAGPEAVGVPFTVAPIGVMFSQKYIKVPLEGYAAAKRQGIARAARAKGPEARPC